MDAFVYEPIDLERPAFRLLQLLRGKGSAIECILYQGYLDGADTIPYDALSYTWSGTDKTSTVTVNGKSLDVTENLHLALQHLRSENEDRIIWVDAICIDQSNTRERGHQVQQMCKIYSQAEEVVVWLGQATQETDVLMESLQQLEGYSSKHGCKRSHWDREKWNSYWLRVPRGPGHALCEGLDLLLARPWFKRVWVLQEIANAKKASILCGTKSIRAQIFALAPSLIQIKPNRHCQAVLDIMPGHLREETWWSENRDLYNLLLKFSESQASDPRDKVYALLGISSDAQNTDRLRPDYTKNLQKVIYDTFSFMFGPSNVFYETMSKLLGNLPSRNVASFVEFAKISHVIEADHFLKRLGPEVQLSQDMVKAAAGNDRNGLEIMSLLLHKFGFEFKVTRGVIEAVVGKSTSGMEIINMLLRECEGSIRRTVYEELEKASSEDHRGVRELLGKNAFIRNVKGTMRELVDQASPSTLRKVVEILFFHAGANGDVKERMLKPNDYRDTFGLPGARRARSARKPDFTWTEEMHDTAFQAASNKRRRAVLRLMQESNVPK